MRRAAAPSPLASTCRYAGAAGLAAAIFAVDSFTALGSAVAVLYVLVLILVGDTSERVILACAISCIALTLASFLLVHGLSTELEVLLRLTFSLSAILGTTFLILMRHADRVTVESQAELLDVTSDAIFLTDAKGQVIYWNRGAESLYGWSFEEAWGKDPHALLATRFPQPRASIDAALAATGAWEGEIAQTARDGRTVNSFSRWQRRPRLGRYQDTTLQTNTDITARKTADEALRQSERRYRTIFETLAVAIWEHDLRPVKAALDAITASGVPDLAAHLAQHPEAVAQMRTLIRVTDVNGTALKLMGAATKDDFFTRLDEFLPDTEQNFGNFLLALAEGRPYYEAETTIRTLQGEFLRVIAAFNFPPDGSLDRVQVSVLNITERIRVQEALERTRNQLDRALRAATFGEVSASIAHEINQPLAAISTQAAAARRWMDRDPPDLVEVRACLDQAAAAAHRASEVVRRVRTLMAKVEPDRVLLEITPLVEEALQLVRNELRNHSVTLASALPADTWHVKGDRILLQQVIINLMTNAIQAMQAVPAEQRRLTVRIAQDGERIGIEVGDTGPGFSGQAAERAFEPFFTTKSTGMGLGLAMCRTIIIAHDGEIAIGNADEGRGGKVSITLPAASDGDPAAEA